MAALARLYAFLVVGALLVHELRYGLAFGESSDEALAATGHAYLTFAGPLVGMAAALVFSALVLRAAASASPESSARSIRLRRLWPLASVAIFVVFAGQEVLEGLLAPGHPTGVEAVVGDGGWIALPVALLIGGGIAFMIQVVEKAVHDPQLGSGWLSGYVVRPVDAGTAFAAASESSTASAPLRHLAGRGPPQSI